MIVNLKPVKTENGIPEQYKKVQEEYEEYTDSYVMGNGCWQEEATDLIQTLITKLSMTEEGLKYWMKCHEKKMTKRLWEERKK